MNDSEKGERLFNQLPAHEQERIQALSPVARLEAVRALGRSFQPATQQATQATQATPKVVDVPPEKRAIAESFARTLPIGQQLELENLDPVRRIERTWELKDYADRHNGDLPKI